MGKQGRVSSALLERVAMQIAVKPVSAEVRSADADGEQSAAIVACPQHAAK